MQPTARNEFTQALKALTQERGIEVETILETLKEAYVAAYKRDARDRGEDVDAQEFDAEINGANGEAKIFSWPLEKPEERKDVTPPGFGRIAAQTAKQVIHQKIREAEKTVLFADFEGRVGSLISGMVLRFDGPNVRVDLGRAEGFMPAEERTSSERLNIGQRLTFLLKAIEETPRGKQILLSRADPEFVKKVFAREVPEIAAGSVEIRNIAREPGVRTKIAVVSSQPGVDPVGSCVGQKGIRVQAVTNELGGERIDIIPWTDDSEDFVKATLAPVNVIALKLDRTVNTAFITVPDSELSLAIGKEGQNVRLASKLTGFRIEVQGDGSGPVVKPEETPELASVETPVVVEEITPKETPVESAEETPAQEESSVVEKPTDETH
jgi:N utilization substance protein A